jgi:hypothetical protein
MKMKHTRKTKTGGDTSIVNGALYFEDAKQCDVDSETLESIIGDGYCNSIRVISLDRNWYTNDYIGFDAVIKSDVNMQFTMRREVRNGRGYWYAYRRVLGKLHKRFMGQDADINQKRLLDVARKLPTT